MWEMLSLCNLIKDKNSKSESYYFNGTIIDNEILQFLKSRLKYSDIARICIHSNRDELTQSMIIGITDKKVIKPHKNQYKDKIYYIIEGEIEFQTDKKYILKKGEFFKLEKNNYMSMKSISNISIYNEIVAGAFKEGDTIYAS